MLNSKSIFIINIFLLFFSSAFSQNTTSIKFKIDSLNYDLKIISNKLDSLNYLKEIVKKNIIASNRELELLEVGNNSETKIEVVAGLGAKIRSEPNSNASILKDLKIGEIFLITNYFENDFLGAESGGIIGYVSKNAFEYNQNVQTIINYHSNKIKIEASAKLIEIEKNNPKLGRLIRMFGEENGNKIYKKQYWIGMTSNMATESLGKPSSINVSSGDWGYHSQWVYHNGLYLYFENGILTSYQR